MKALISVVLSTLMAGSVWASTPEIEPIIYVIETNLGNIEIQLENEKAPVTSGNFVAYAETKFFDGLIFHRVVKNFVIQGGGLEPGLQEKPSTFKPIKNESDNGLSNLRGTVAMARTTDPDSATNQFYINLKDNVFLDYKPGKPGYAVFAKVVAGIDVVDKIAAVQTTTQAPYDDVPVATVLIKSVKLK